MKNVVLSMLAKISKIDAGMKQLTARVEAQSLLISALVLAVISREGGVTQMIESANKAINTVIDSAECDELLRSDAALLLSEFQNLLAISCAVDGADEEINQEGIVMLKGLSHSPD